MDFSLTTHQRTHPPIHNSCSSASQGATDKHSVNLLPRTPTTSYKMRASVANVFLSALALGSGLAESARLPRREESGTVVTTTVTEAAASPTGAPSASDWAAGATRDVPIHRSCNGTQRALLSRGLDDAMKLAGHARDHVLRFGNSSDFYVKYFGSAPTAEVIGWYDRIVYGDKGGIWFRCDDIDGNCQQDGELFTYLSRPRPRTSSPGF